MLTTNLTVTQVDKHVHWPRKVDEFFQLPVGDSFICPGCPAPPGCIAEGNACNAHGGNPMYTAVGLLTLRAMSHARSLHDPCVQCLSGCTLSMSFDDESNCVGPCLEGNYTLFQAKSAWHLEVASVIGPG